MDYSTISNKTNCTEIEEITNGELSERYFILKKQYENLSSNYDSVKQELHDTRRSYQTALDVQGHLTAELESLQSEEAKRRSDLTSRIHSLQEEISVLRQDRSEVLESHEKEISRLQNEVKRLKEEIVSKKDRSSPERDNVELEETRNALVSAKADTVAAKEALDAARNEALSWKIRGEELTVELEQMKEVADMRREELRAANERESVALSDLAEARALLHQCTDSQDLQPHAAKGNSIFAEVEDKRQEMAKSLLQMKQTNSKLRRELANKQAEVDALLHEKQTVWEQQLGASAHYDRELIESYEERISQLTAQSERQRRELARWFAKGVDSAAHGWLPGVLQHLTSECEKLREEALSRGATQLASAAQVRDLRRKLATLTAQTAKQNKESPTSETQAKQRISFTKIQDEDVIIVPQKKMAPKLTSEDARKKVTFN